MCCSGNPSIEAPEFNKRFKFENNNGCCQHGVDSCDLPSKAREGSALWEWEQIHGRIINQVTQQLGSDGRFHLVHVKTTCPEIIKKRSKGCCAIRYKILR